MYCTLDDLTAQVPADVLRTLTDDAGAGAIDQAKIDRAIQQAQSEIDAYAQKQYPVPFDPVPDIIVKVCADIALYNLFSRRGFTEDGGDRVIQERYKAAVKLLENLAKGLVTLGGAPAPPPPEGPRFEGPERIFSRESLKGM